MSRQALQVVRGGSTSIPEGTAPPCDLEAEAAVLAVVMLEYTTDRVADLLEPDMFYSGAHRRIYEAAHALSKAGKPADNCTIGTKLKDEGRIAEVGGLAYLTDVLNVGPSMANARAYASTVREKWRLRELANRCGRIQARVYCQDHGEVQAFIEEAEASLVELSRTPETSTVEQAKPVIRRVVESIQRGYQGSTGTPSGFGAVDRMTSGMGPKELSLIGARPGMGKSAFALNIATNVATSLDADGREQGVVFFGMEMPKEQTMRRALCSIGNVCVSRAKAGMLNATEWSSLQEAARVLAMSPLWVDDQAGQTIFQIRAKIRQLQSHLARRTPNPARLRLVVVDYLQLLRGSPEATKQGREAVVSENARGLKGIAMDEDVHIIALSQLKREIDARADKRPTLSDLRESGELEQAADKIAFIYREDYYARKKWRDREPFRGTHEAEIHYAKIRDGEPGMVKLLFQDKYTRFENDPMAEERGEA